MARPEDITISPGAQVMAAKISVSPAQVREARATGQPIRSLAGYSQWVSPLHGPGLLLFCVGSEDTHVVAVHRWSGWIRSQ